MKILLLGHSGILGNRLRSILDCYTTEYRFPSEPFTNELYHKYDVIINCIVDKNGDYSINVELPLLLSKFTKKLVHFCSDAVYSGGKELGSQYTKTDDLSPTNFYGETKAKSSTALLKNTNALVIRTSFIDQRSEFVQKISCDSSFKAYSNYYWNGLTAKQVAEQTKKLLLSESMGLYHVFGHDTYSKYTLANMVANFLNRPTKIHPVSFEKKINRSVKTDFDDLNFDINTLQ